MMKKWSAILLGLVLVFTARAQANLCVNSGRTSQEKIDIPFELDVDKPVVVLAGAYSTGAYLAQAFKNAGVQIVHIKPNQKVDPLIISSLKPEVFGSRVLDQAKLTDAQILAILKVLEPRAVIAGNEFAVPIADKFAQKMNVPSNLPDPTSARRNKYQMHKKLGELAEPLAKDFQLSGFRVIQKLQTGELAKIKSWVSQRGEFPVVLKQPEGAGGRHVYICRNMAEVEAAYHKIINAKSELGEPMKKVLVEEYIDGTEYVVNTVSRTRNGETKTIVAAIYKYEKTDAVYHRDILLERQGELQARLAAYTRAVLKGLGIQNGPAHAEIFVTKNGEIVLGEIGARLMGGSNIKFEKSSIQRDQADLVVESILKPEAFMKRPDTYNVKLHYSNVSVVNYNDGAVLSAFGMPKIRSLKSFKEVIWIKQPGTIVPRTTDMFTSPVTVVLQHKDARVVEQDYKQLKAWERDGIFEFRRGGEKEYDAKNDDVLGQRGLSKREFKSDAEAQKAGYFPWTTRIFVRNSMKELDQMYVQQHNMDPTGGAFVSLYVKAPKELVQQTEAAYQRVDARGEKRDSQSERLFEQIKNQGEFFVADMNGNFRRLTNEELALLEARGIELRIYRRDEGVYWGRNGYHDPKIRGIMELTPKNFTQTGSSLMKKLTRMARTILDPKKQGYRIIVNDPRYMRPAIEAAQAMSRHNQEGAASRITKEEIAQFEKLAYKNQAYSVVIVSREGKVVAGLYGKRNFGKIDADSVFYPSEVNAKGEAKGDPDLARVAVLALTIWAHRNGYKMIDVQMRSSFTATMRGENAGREKFHQLSGAPANALQRARDFARAVWSETRQQFMAAMGRKNVSREQRRQLPPLLRSNPALGVYEFKPEDFSYWNNLYEAQSSSQN